MTSSINTNIAAYYAQANITSASNLASSSVARLSSGNRIVQASDDVSALAIGTSLGTQVSALKTAQTNASQGSSLLQVADGALAQIQTILQQQQSIANQAQSGSLTDVDRGFLNQQFQALSNEINSLASSTTFNGVNLIDGSIATGGSTNPLRTASTGSNTTAANVTGFTAGVDVTGFTSFKTANASATNDTSFIGDLSQGVFTVTVDPTTATNYAISYALNGSTYQGTWDSTTGSVTLSNSVGSRLTLAMTANNAPSAGTLQTELTTAFKGATAFAIHQVATALATDSSGNTIAGSAITAASTAGTLLNTIDGSKISITSQTFDAKVLPPIADFTSSGFGANTAFSVQVNGVTYSTGTGDTVANPTLLSGAQWGSDTLGHLVLYKNGDSTANPNEKIDINLTTLGNNALITTAADVQHVVDALNTAFGTGGAAGGLTFQLGTTASSNVAVNIGSAKTTALFGGTSLDVSTQGGATTASTAVGNALNTVTALRSGVGALESQFNFASAALQSSVQNQSAAQSSLLDTDIASESTNFATEQVKLQAGISVLAQANQQLQALLKLIG